MPPMPLPVVLKTDTIWECVFEARFSAGNPSIADILPGMLFERLTPLVSTTQQLPAFNIPFQFRELDDNLRYQATHALLSKELHVGVGPRSVAVSFPKPYRGWREVKQRILQVMEAVNSTKLAGQAERCSLKYVNVLTQGRDEFDFSQLKVQVSLDDFPLGGSVVVRAEIPLNGCQTVVEVITGAKVQDVRPDPRVASMMGVLLAVDTIRPGPFDNFFARLPELIESVHDTEKQIYFGLLTKETLEKLGPRYE